MGDRVAVMRTVPPADRRPEDALRAAPQPVRRRVHRVAGDELVVADVERSDGDVCPRSGLTGCASSRRHWSATRPRAFDGGKVVLGIRPEDMEDAAILRETHPDRVMSVVRDIREDMGSEVYVHFNVPPTRCRPGR